MVCLWLAYQLRFDFNPPPLRTTRLLSIGAMTVLTHLFALFCFHQFDGLLTYFSTPDVKRLAAACTAGSRAIGVFWFFGQLNLAPPRSVILMDYVLSFTALATTRYLFRYGRRLGLGSRVGSGRKARRVGIVGAGDTGAALAKDLLAKPWLGLRPVAFFDDLRHTRSRVHGIPVVGDPERIAELSHGLRLDELIIAMPSASHQDRKRAASLATAAGLQVLTVPSFEDLVSGRVTVSQIRAVELDDLLGRDPVVLDGDGLKGWIAGQVVLITGAGGSIGSELCRQIGPRLLVMVESSEFALYQIEQEFSAAGSGRVPIAAIAGDVRSAVRMAQVMRQHRPSVVLHAAAYKHVPLMETGNCAEAVLNNVGGTWTVARAAIDAGVEKFVLISTDKAVNPTNVMGATKRLAEVVCERLQETTAGTRFVMVRFGNVLGSAGSVIPRFRDQIAAGGPVTVTHPEITRFFMSIPEAAQLVLQAGLMGRGGEIFVLDMGEPVRIADLARSMIRLSGFAEDEIRIVYSGLRPGEKLFEELLADEEHTLTTPHPKLRIAQARQAPEGFLDQLGAWLEALRAGASDDAEVKQRLAVFVPEYSPQGLHPVGPGRTEHAGNAR